ncbi:MAG: formylglycine-generating enzyme family protein [Myxococcota bacterium]
MTTSYTQIPRAVMWLIKGDEAQIGGSGGDTEPAHTLEIGSFYISRGPISNEQYEAFDPSHERHPLSPGDNDPVVNVHFEEACGYAAWYAKIANKAFRLPTEAEWEFAARALGMKQYPWGNSPGDASRYAWTKENSDGHCHPVDSPTPSRAGLYGMIGNTWEWTSSLYRPYPILPDDGRDTLDTDEPRVVRGGGFHDPIAELSCARRKPEPSSYRSEALSFRIVRSL